MYVLFMTTIHVVFFGFAKKENVLYELVLCEQRPHTKSQNINF